MDSSPIKLLPRNVAALRKGQRPADGARLVTGNPISTRLESGIGNCFPGLECDLRNLERRFFPGLEVDIQDNSITVVGVDVAAAAAAVKMGHLVKAALSVLTAMDAEIREGQTFRVQTLTGDFGGQGQRTLKVATMAPVTTGTQKPPPDAWTAIRLLPEGSRVTLRIRAVGLKKARVLTGLRAAYLDDKGALSAAFLPGEMTQSLCSPWTHDFRDCGCFYWASNHPDIAKPPLPASLPSGPEWNSQVQWERADRTLEPAPPKATQDGNTPILDYYEINQRWQELNFVIGGRELETPYAPQLLNARPLQFPGELIAHLRYAAGVELAVIQEYLAAAFSLRDPSKLKGALRRNVTAAHAEIMRVAVSEMRHLRAVNDVLRSLHPDGAFQPALQVAAQLPIDQPGKFRPLLVGSANRKAIDGFIEIEKPSESVDGLYSSILITLVQHGNDDLQHAIRTIMAEGEDHFETFQFIREWLKPHEEAQYLRGIHMTPPPSNDDDHRELQKKYRSVLEDLYNGYQVGFPQGAPAVNEARNFMVLPNALRKTIEKIISRGFLVAFAPLADPRFKPIPPP